MTSSSDAFGTKRHLVSFVCVPVAFLSSGWNVTETSFWYLPQVIWKHLTVLSWGGVLLVAGYKKSLASNRVFCVCHVPFPSLPDDQKKPVFHSHYSYFFPDCKRTQMTRTVQLQYLNRHTEWKTSSQVSTFSVLHTFSNSTGYFLNALNTVFCV